MKQLYEGNTTSQEWDKQIITDLSFIRAKLRYPLRRKLLAPLIAWTVFFLLICAVIFSSLLNGSGSPGMPFFIFLPLIGPVLLVIRYLHSLKFVTVHTPFTLADNIKILDRFLTSQRMLIFRHPDAPEIFQILSKDVGTGSEEREIMIFIADEQRILVNSQFTNAGWRLPQGKSHVDEMCGRLMQFMKVGSSASRDLQLFE